jgi:hypothetical protein
LEIFRTQPEIAVVVTDIQMSGMSGLNVLREVKLVRPHTQVILITGFSDVRVAVAGMKAGAYTYIQKPFDFQEFLSHVETALRIVNADALLARLSGIVFLSYAREDYAAVTQLFEKLKAAGFQPWMDKHSISPGTPWDEAIGTAIRSASVFVACLTRVSISKRGHVQREFKLALDTCRDIPEGQVYFLPLRFEPCDVPESLAAYQWVDYFEQDGWQRLVDGIRKALEHKAPPRE